LLSSSDCSPRVSLSDFGLLVHDLDAYIKEEPSYTAAIDVPFTSQTHDMITCSLWPTTKRSLRVTSAELRQTCINSDVYVKLAVHEF